MSISQPSKEYLENIEFYKKMHKEGYYLKDGSRIATNDAYNGKSTLDFAKLIKKLKFMILPI